MMCIVCFVSYRSIVVGHWPHMWEQLQRAIDYVEAGDATDSVFAKGESEWQVGIYKFI